MPHSSRHAHNAVQDGKEAVGEAREAGSSFVDEAKDAVKNAADRAQAVGGQAADYVRHQYDDLSGRGRDTYARTRDAVRDCEETTAGYIKQSPLKAILIALGLGLVIGLIWRRND
ncbi:MAG TPA: hypothetical protein VG326_18010 [Tepidisphaeraceae bacterium]|jgi:ElaB/YqjD/DUF883 family membrane-anchored ribosome-binding protein|nr:hypothetical protein [Tepidisphaeraceae bacterium]